jgi:small subunit ribosomal protein S6
LFLLDPNRYARDAGGVSRKVGEMIEKCGGEVLVSRLWADQKLAYPIEGHKKGVYWITYFHMEGTRHPELTRATKLNNDVLRAQVIRLDPRIAGMMVEHAAASKGSAPSTERPARTGRPEEAERVEVAQEEE